ncbi:unnamed protein product [Effrenium voratum]|uniref:VWFA domain-containing protein n=1 Tax=Effrenium voratum TaxID=2562239 RepID=A0AA36HS04_9DINO|nr:unnamed protein product [Effrenium voratum]
MVSAPGSGLLGPAPRVARPAAALPAQNAPSIVVGSHHMPSALAAGAASPQRWARLQQILDRFEVSIAEANDLTALEDYEIVLILDDSSSMNMSSKPPEHRRLGEASTTRWEELKESAALLVDLACCFDRSGVDIFFLNRGMIDGVKSASDPRLVSAFAGPANGRTPLTEALRTVAEHCQGEKPILLLIFTDGEPNDGVKSFERELKRLVTRKSTSTTFRVQIMACTADEDAVGYLNDIDEKFDAVDVTDDYFSEMLEVLKKAKSRKQFTRGDWLMKALLGPISRKFDAWDETGKKAGARSFSSEDSDEGCVQCSIC